MRQMILSAILASSFLLSGCIPVASPAIGILLTDVHDPNHSNGKVGPKRGEACAQSILGLVAQGDASIWAAAKAGGITKIDTVDTYSNNMLGIIARFCTVVHGS